MVKRKLSLSEWEKWSEDRDRTERTNLVLTFLAQRGVHRYRNLPPQVGKNMKDEEKTVAYWDKKIAEFDRRERQRELVIGTICLLLVFFLTVFKR
jgi:hypothetical protein